MKYDPRYYCFTICNIVCLCRTYFSSSRFLCFWIANGRVEMVSAISKWIKWIRDKRKKISLRGSCCFWYSLFLLRKSHRHEQSSKGSGKENKNGKKWQRNEKWKEFSLCRSSSLDNFQVICIREVQNGRADAKYHLDPCDVHVLHPVPHGMYKLWEAKWRQDVYGMLVVHSLSVLFSCLLVLEWQQLVWNFHLLFFIFFSSCFWCIYRCKFFHCLFIVLSMCIHCTLYVSLPNTLCMQDAL